MSQQQNGQNSEYKVLGGIGIVFEANAGQYITTIDLEGAQIGDFVAAVADEPDLNNWGDRHDDRHRIGFGDIHILDCGGLLAVGKTL